MMLINWNGLTKETECRQQLYIEVKQGRSSFVHVVSINHWSESAVRITVDRNGLETVRPWIDRGENVLG